MSKIVSESQILIFFVKFEISMKDMSHKEHVQTQLYVIYF